MLNIYFAKQTVKLKKDFIKVSSVGLLFDLAQFSFGSVLVLVLVSFGSALKME